MKSTEKTKGRSVSRTKESYTFGDKSINKKTKEVTSNGTLKSGKTVKVARSTSSGAVVDKTKTKLKSIGTVVAKRKLPGQKTQVKKYNW
jgi:hypothetical protein